MGPMSDVPAEPPSMKELIAFIAQNLVDEPDAVEVREVEHDGSTMLELRVATGDLGKVIGKQGRTARAMRTILSAASTRSRKRIVLDIVE